MIETFQAKEELENVLQKLNNNRQIRKANVILDAFKKFSKIEINGSRDDFLFQCGVFNFTGERLFCWDLVRQFMAEMNNE